MNNICFYTFNGYSNPIMEFNKDGYFCPLKDAKDNQLYNRAFLEWQIIEKINRNEEGYFDFTKNMIDIGAHVGIYSWTLSFNHTYAFEPNKEHLAILLANLVHKDKLNQTTVYNCLLSCDHNPIQFDGWSGAVHTGRENNIHSVIPSTLDDFKKDIQNIGFIKIDVEGMEWKVLKGACEIIKENNYPPILFEDWKHGAVDYKQETEKEYKYRTKHLYKILNDLGYEILDFWGDWETHLAINKQGK